MQDPDRVERLLVSLETMVQSQMALITSLTDRQSNLEQKFTELLDRLIPLLSNSSQPTPPASVEPSINPTYAAMAAAYRVEATRDVLESKKQRLVVLNLPEKDTPEQTSASDEKFLESLVSELNVPSFTAAYHSGSISHHRHEGRKPLPGERKSTKRPLKIDVKDGVLRDAVLRAVARAGRMQIIDFPGCYVRRDYSPDELKLESEAKKRAWQMNTNAGEIQFGVREFEVIRFSHARPFSRKPSGRR